MLKSTEKKLDTYGYTQQRKENTNFYMNAIFLFYIKGDVYCLHDLSSYISVPYTLQAVSAVQKFDIGTPGG
jgi:hypothetical protein